jgi:eukaryotic-like serine/threonine-protein kinase
LRIQDRKNCRNSNGAEMKNSTHISENDLRLALDEQSTNRTLHEIEDHIDQCDSCRSRMMELAADPKWRKEFTEGLRHVSQSDHSRLSPINEKSRFPASSFTGHDRVGHTFDLQTVEHMLQDVLESPIHPETMGRMGRYEIESVIGCGGMGVVLRGFDRELHRPVAIKMILPRLSKNGTAKQRFSREARAAATVLHPNVISIHDIRETKGLPWFVMPLIIGPSLKTMVNQDGPLLEKEVVRVGIQIASGLAAAHSKGLVHRDIKPENILVDNQVNRIVITDFGLACSESEDAITQTGWVAGTLNFMSPEQSRGEDVDCRSDLFSLGSVLFFLVTGEMPFWAKSELGVIYNVGNVRHRNVQSLNPDVSTMLKQTIDRLLEKSREKRFQTAAEVEVFLSDYLAYLHHPSIVSKPKLTRVSRDEIKRGGSVSKNTRALLAVGLTVCCIVLAISGAWWAASSGNNDDGGAGKLPDAELSNRGETLLTLPVNVSQWNELSNALLAVGQQCELADQSLDSYEKPNLYTPLNRDDITGELLWIADELDMLDTDGAEPSPHSSNFKSDNLQR